MKLKDWVAGRVELKGRTSQPTRGKMNGLEARYAKHLERRRQSGEVAVFWYEAWKFRLMPQTL